MSIYVAGKYTSKDRLAVIRQRLRQMGLVVTSSWLDEIYESDHDGRVTDDIRKENAMRDFVEVRLADTFLLDTFDESATGGREVELGMALTRGITCFRVGPYRNVFHTLVDNSFDSWDECIEWIARHW